MKTVFISYAREDKDIALRLYTDLVGIGHAPWLDEKDLLPGQDWASTIRKRIKKCHYFLCVFSRHSITKRGFFQKEIRYALDIFDEIPNGQIFFIPCRTEKIDIEHEAISKLQLLDLFPSYDDALDRLRNSLNHGNTEYSSSEELQRAIEQAQRNIFQANLNRAKHVVENPIAFNLPQYTSKAILRTLRPLRRVNETIMRLQQGIPIMNWIVSPRISNEYYFQFSHQWKHNELMKNVERAFNSEGVSMVQVSTARTDVPANRSMMLLTDDPTEVIIRYPGGKSVMSTENGVFDVESGRELSEKELEKLNETTKRYGGYSMGSPRRTQ